MLGADGAAKLGFAPCTGAAGRVFCWAGPAAAACPSESGAPQRMQNLELSGLCSKPQEGHFFIKTSGRCLGCCAKLEPGWRIGRYANVPVSHRKHIKRMGRRNASPRPLRRPAKGKYCRFYAAPPWAEKSALSKNGQAFAVHSKNDGKIVSTMNYKKGEKDSQYIR